MSDAGTQAPTNVATGVSRRRVLAASAAVGVAAGTLHATKAVAAAPERKPDHGSGTAPWKNGRLIVSDNGRFLQHQNGKPFFWLGDTAWLLHKLSKDDIGKYFADRRRKSFNVAQLQVVPASLDYKNHDGETPFVQHQIRQPNPAYWSYVDYIVDQAAQHGIYMAMDTVWGSIVTSGQLTGDDAAWYGDWIGKRYKDKPNIVWLNGGDTKADQALPVWLTLGAAIRKADPNHLITFHPFGRYSSSTWFHDADWLDFNMFQSGHRTYQQSFDAATPEVTGVELPTLWKGEGNWKDVIEDYKLYPPKPTLDGEPSYEGIPQGLHDPTQPLWNDDDVRRYAYWSVFAGACGHTYGNGAVMSMHLPSDGPTGAYGVTKYWDEAIHDPGAGQVQHLQQLMLSRPYFQRIYDPTVVIGDPGFQHDHLITTRGDDFLFAYIYTGRSFSLQLGKLSGDVLKAWWYRPKDGSCRPLGHLKNSGVRRFDPPGRPAPGNDWVLVLDDAAQEFARPGEVS
ncbi:DUF4038 domain-containing protein [Microlunatus elymi]|uniref:DUF4038 domain-containing protein n=1 Tax=Microlunatus elymi TaxID=2596828 RepID=A0A516Q120_9ACTN|nr:glycoside hydrolase family 140 protein [Microlunatus elymi]QDP97082.1 DUF4038 domain-containing protein [Microlunatus elymi]